MLKKIQRLKEPFVSKWHTPARNSLSFFSTQEQPDGKKRPKFFFKKSKETRQNTQPSHFVPPTQSAAMPEAVYADSFLLDGEFLVEEHITPTSHASSRLARGDQSNLPQYEELRSEAMRDRRSKQHTQERSRIHSTTLDFLKEIGLDNNISFASPYSTSADQAGHSAATPHTIDVTTAESHKPRPGGMTPIERIALEKSEALYEESTKPKIRAQMEGEMALYKL